MDQKAWIWKKRSAHKSIDSEAGISVKGNEEERVQYEKEAALERTLKNLHEKIASLLCECNTKDTLIAEHAKTVEEAIAGRENVEKELALKNQELESAVQQKSEANERLIHLNSALKDYRHQLTSLKEDQDQKLNEAIEELKKTNKRLSDKLNESTKTLTDLTVENARISKTLVIKEELIEDVSHQMSQATLEFNDLITRLDSTEKENGILKYEYRVLERELEIQTRCADVANGQHRESVKRAAKMESECQKLRAFVKKQVIGSGLDGLDKRMGFMINRLYEIEEENKILKEIIRKKDDEISVLQAGFDRNGASLRSDMSLMDDFVEMERLAIVSSDSTNFDSVGKELVAVSDSDRDWLPIVLNAILEETRVSKRGLDEVLNEITKSLESYDSVTWKSPGVETELESVKDQLENQKMVNEDLDHQLSVAKFQINEANQKISGLKVELEDRCHCCEELEATCLELQLQLASVSDKEVEKVNIEKEEKPIETGLEITAASEKLAECQETIISIGRQLKALAPPPEAVELTGEKKSRRHACLRDHMVAEEEGEVVDPVMKEVVSVMERKAGCVVRVGSCKARVVPGALAIVPSKKRSKGSEILKKLLFRRKRGSSKKVLTISA